MTLETGIIADLLDPEKDTALLLETVRQCGLKSDYFADNAARAAFAAMIASGSTDPAILLDKAKTAAGVDFICKVIPDAASGSRTLDENAGASVSLDKALVRIRQMAEAGKKDVLATYVQKGVTFGQQVATAADLAAYLHESLDKAMSQVDGDNAADSENMSFAEFTDPIPENENPDALIRGGWLRRGQGAVLVSYSGVGKSVISIQLAYAWARGEAALGIAPVRPLKIGVLQSEDDAEEMKMFCANIRRGYREMLGWTDGDIAVAEQNLSMPRKPVRRTGASFTAYLRNWQRRNKFDLIIVNPLHAFCGCDLSNNAALHDFLRVQIDGAINMENAKCGLIFIHHTNKPPTDPRDRGGFVSDRYAEYAGAGGAEITNWARSFLVIKPLSERGRFDLIAAKHGDRLHWPTIPGDKASKPHRHIAHSENGLIFWQDVEMVIDGEKGGRKESSPMDPDVLAAELVELMREQKKSLTATELRDLARGRFNRKIGDAVYTHLVNNMAKFGVNMRKGDNNNVKFYEPGVLPL